MKKILSGILALSIAGAMFTPAFAADASIAENSIITVVDGEEKTPAGVLKTEADKEEDMLRISPSMLVKIKLKLEGENENNNQMTFITRQAADANASASNIQYIDQQDIDSDGVVNIQFRPRESDPIGIYNMRANVKNVASFSKYYKTVKEQIQPTLSKPSETQKGQNIELTVSGYTEGWKAANKLYDITNSTPEEIPAEDYSFEDINSDTKIATLKIKTTSEWAALGEHTLRFIPEETGGAYNPITIKADIVDPTKVRSDITVNFVSSTGKAIPEGWSGKTTLPGKGDEDTNMEFEATAPIGYSVTKVEYQLAGGEKSELIASDNKYSFTMPAENVTVTITVTPIEYTINLDLQGGEGINNTEIPGSAENLPQMPSEEPTKKGSSFTGWFVQTESGRREITQKIINENFETIIPLFNDEHNLTVTAIYAANGTYEVVYQAPDAEAGTKPTGGNFDAIENPTITISDVEPVRAGYEFTGWIIEGDETETVYKANGDNNTYTVPENVSKVTFIAQWKEIETDDYKIMGVDTDNSAVNVIKRTNEEAWVIVATYTEKGNLVKATIKDITSVKTNAAGTSVEMPDAFSGDYTTVKVFMWNSLSSMQPRCNAF